MRTLILSILLLATVGNASPPNWIRMQPTALAAPSGWPINFLATYETNTAGDVVTTNMLTAKTFGYNAGRWQTSVLNFGPQAPLVNGKVGGMNLDQSFNYVIGGVTYDGSGTRSLHWNFDTDWTTTWESTFYIMPVPNAINAGQMAVSVNILFQPVADADIDVLGITTEAGSWCIFEAHCDGAGHVDIKMHSKGFDGNSTTGNPVPLNTNTVYKISIRPSVALGEVEGVVQIAATGELIGCSRCVGDINQNVAYFGVQDYLQFTGGDVYLDNLAAGFSNNATLPLGPITIPAPGNLIAYQITTNSIGLSWGPDNCLRYSISRFNVQSNAWTIATTNCEGAAFTDTGLTLSNSYYYAVSGIIGENTSAASTNSATVFLNAGATGPVQWYLGNSTTDYSGNGRTGTWSGTPVYGTGFDGTPEQAFLFDGSFITAPIASFTHYTVSFWIKSGVAPAEVGYTRCFSAGANDAIGFIWDHASSTYIQAAYQQDSGATYYATQIPDTLSANTWYFVTVTWDGANQKIFLNGTLKATTAVTSLATPLVSLCLASLVSGDSGSFFTGYMQDFRIYDRDLPNGEISTLFALQPFKQP